MRRESVQGAPGAPIEVPPETPACGRCGTALFGPDACPWCGLARDQNLWPETTTGAWEASVLDVAGLAAAYNPDLLWRSLVSRSLGFRNVVRLAGHAWNNPKSPRVFTPGDAGLAY